MQQKDYTNEFSEKRDEDVITVSLNLYVITLERTPKRLEWFLLRNSTALQNCNVQIVQGIDGEEHKKLFKRSRLISSDLLNRWSTGAVGSALSHMLCWRKCIQIGEPIIIAEDDVSLANEIKEKLMSVLKRNKEQPNFLLLGWNMDSLLQAETPSGFEMISLFEPAYPKEEEIWEIVNSTVERDIFKLIRCFGLPAYRITPKMAKHLLERMNPVVSETIGMPRGIPSHYSETLDGGLNNEYRKIDAKIVFPPLALALNKQEESLTRKTKQFGGK